MTYGIAERESLTDTLRRLQGDERQVDFAARLGITQGELSKFLRGQRGLSRKIAASVIRTYPQLQQRVVDALIAEAA
jgi:hypothetical protein